MNPPMESGDIVASQGSTEMAVTLQKAGIFKALQVGFSPLGYTITTG